jgi:hypothetical protein
LDFFNGDGPEYTGSAAYINRSMNNTFTKRPSKKKKLQHGPVKV